MATTLFRRLGEPEFALNGAPLAGGFVYYYQFGTTTLQDTFLDAAGTILNANPLPLDGNGRFQTAVYLGDTTTKVAYKQVVKTATGVVVSTMDNIPAATPIVSASAAGAEAINWVQKTAADSPIALTAAQAGIGYELDTTSGGIIVSISTAASVGNNKAGFVFKKTAAANIVSMSSVSTIDGSGTYFLHALNREMKISSDGSRYLIDRIYDPYPGGVGEVRKFPFATVPSGWLECNGAAVGRLTYAKLFAALGIIHGQGDGSTTFNLPDYRGRFLRGWDHAGARDPDAASRTAPATGGATGDNVGSVQSSAFQTHKHWTAANESQSGVGSWSTTTQMAAEGGTGLGGNTTRYQLAGTATDATVGLTSSPSSGNTSTETRPQNANVLYCIKVE